MYVLPLSILYLFVYDFCQTSYLDIHRTDLCKICRIGRTMAVDEQSEICFSIPQGTLLWQPILWGGRYPQYSTQATQYRVSEFGQYLPDGG